MTTAVGENISALGTGLVAEGASCKNSQISNYFPPPIPKKFFFPRCFCLSSRAVGRTNEKTTFAKYFLWNS